MADNLHLTTEHETRDNHLETAVEIVQGWALTALGVPDDTGFYVVWFCFILGGWKALVSSTEPDGRYYEVTFNKDTGKAYLDTYVKTHNVAVGIK